MVTKSRCVTVVLALVLAVPVFASTDDEAGWWEYVEGVWTYIVAVVVPQNDGRGDVIGDG